MEEHLWNDPEVLKLIIWLCHYDSIFGAQPLIGCQPAWPWDWLCVDAAVYA